MIDSISILLTLNILLVLTAGSFYNIQQQQHYVHCTMINDANQTLNDLIGRSKLLAKAIVSRLGRKVARLVASRMTGMVQDDFKRVGMNYYDQMSLLVRDREFSEFLIGFEDYLDETILAELAALSECERFVLDCRDELALEEQDTTPRLLLAVKDAVKAALDEHRTTRRMQRFMLRYHL